MRERLRSLEGMLKVRGDRAAYSIPTRFPTIAKSVAIQVKALPVHRETCGKCPRRRCESIALGSC